MSIENIKSVIKAAFVLGYTLAVQEVPIKEALTQLDETIGNKLEEYGRT